MEFSITWEYKSTCGRIPIHKKQAIKVSDPPITIISGGFWVGTQPGGMLAFSVDDNLGELRYSLLLGELLINYIGFSGNASLVIGCTQLPVIIWNLSFIHHQFETSTAVIADLMKITRIIILIITIKCFYWNATCYKPFPLP